MASERGGVDGRLGQRAAAVEREPRQGEAVVAAKAGTAVARGHADRAEEAHVVQLEDDPRAGLARGGERARAEQRQHVVEVHDVGSQLHGGGGHVVLVAPAAPERSRRAAAADLGRAALEQRVDDPGAAKRSQLQLHGALLAPLEAVAVVHDEHTHRRDYAIRRWTRRRSRSWSPRAAARRTSRSRSTRSAASARGPLTSSSSSTTGPPTPPAEVAERHGVRCVSHGERRSLNAARNTGLREARAPLIAFVDDDIVAPEGWLDALLEGAERHPEAEALGGPIRARFEGSTPRACGREDPPITTLDLGPEDREAEQGVGRELRGAALRRRADRRVRRVDRDARTATRRSGSSGCAPRAGGSPTSPPPGSITDAPPRTPGSAGSPARPTRAAAAPASSDTRRGRAPGLGRELRVLAGCGWHTVRRACPQGLIMGAHSAGRLIEALRER